MTDINEIKNGMTIIIDGKLCLIEEFQHVKPGKGSAFMKMKLRNLRTGALVEETYNTNIKIERARVERLPMQYLYNDGSNYVFMNNETYEQLELSEDKLADQVKFLKEGLNVYITYYQGEMLGIELPDKIEYVVEKTEPAVKGNTTNNARKDAYMENGLMVRVPLFIEQGEKIIISTKNGEYDSRA